MTPGRFSLTCKFIIRSKYLYFWANLWFWAKIFQVQHGLARPCCNINTVWPDRAVNPKIVLGGQKIFKNGKIKNFIKIGYFDLKIVNMQNISYFRGTFFRVDFFGFKVAQSVKSASLALGSFSKKHGLARPCCDCFYSTV